MLTNRSKLVVKKEMTLEATEFIRRFALHVLPKGFVRIRHYGICSSTSKGQCAVVVKEQMPTRTELKVKSVDNALSYDPRQCPCCKKYSMETLMRFQRRGPPQDWKTFATDLLACITNASATL